MIYTIESPREERRLRRTTRRVKNTQSPEIQILVENMTRICQRRGVAGIAANQLGSNQRMFALSSGTDTPPVICINPVTVAMSEETLTEAEGCLSVPGKSGYVERPIWVQAKWEDLKGKRFSFKFEGFWAKAWMHEMGHLNGELYIDLCDETFTEEDMIKKFEDAQAEAFAQLDSEEAPTDKKVE